jgi:ATP-dependent DNA helicase RecG
VVKKFSLAKTRRRKEKNSVQTQNIASLQFRASVVKIEKTYVPMWFKNGKTPTILNIKLYICLYITQPSLIPDIEVVDIDSKQIVEISIKEFPIKPVSCKGKYFKRVNNSNHQLSLSEISLMHLKTFNSSWDYAIDYNHTLNDISEDKLHSFIAHWNENHRTKIEDSNFEFLQKLELVRESNITNACFLLFAKNDTVLTNIEVGRFQDPITIKDSISISSDLISEVDSIQEFIIKHIRKEYIITGNPRRNEFWEYPLGAIREIVMNMIIHRDYMLSGDSITLIPQQKYLHTNLILLWFSCRIC